MLKSGIRVHNTEAADNIWLTCCALHNLLIDVDGLSVDWENGVPSHWEGERGEFQDDDIPEAIRRLINPDAVRTYDRSSYGWSNPEEERTTVDDDGNEQSIIQNHRIFTGCESVTVNELSLPQFRAMLIEHFNISFHSNKVTWPKRLSTKTPPRHVPN